MPKDKNVIKIKITEDQIMCLVSGVISPFISTKMKNCINTNNSININKDQKNYTKNIYINSQLRLSTTLPLEDTLRQMRLYYKDTRDEILIQRIIIQMMKQLPDDCTIIESGICVDKSNVKHIYGIFLEKEIVSFILRNQELLENVYFSNNFLNSEEDGIFLHKNKIFISEMDSKYNNVIPKSMKDMIVEQKFGGEIIPSLTN